LTNNLPLSVEEREATSREITTISREVNRREAGDDDLEKEWSPQQIAAKLARLHPDDADMRVAHETIYKTFFRQAQGELRTQLKLAPRTGRTARVSPSRATQTRGGTVDMANISERPKEANDRAVPRFWEGDLIIDEGNKSQIATLVERTTRFVMPVRIPHDRTAERVAHPLGRKMEALPKFMRNSITRDQGKELAAHATFTMRTGVLRTSATRTPRGTDRRSTQRPPSANPRLEDTGRKTTRTPDQSWCRTDRLRPPGQRQPTVWAARIQRSR
jgi:IS30 family transposase